MDPGNADPDHLVVLTGRVVRGVNRLLLDPGLGPHHRVRLEIDLRLLTALDLSDQWRASRELLRSLPRMIEIVETVTPLYLRLHTDLTALLDAVTELAAAEPLRLFPLPLPLTPAEPEDDAEPSEKAHPAPVAVSPDAIPPPPTPAGRWQRHRLRFAVAVVGLVCPVVVAGAGGFATGRIGPAVLALAALCPVGAVAGVVTRAVVHPDTVPVSMARRLDPPPDGLTVGLHRAAAEAWLAHHDEPIGV